LAVWFLVASGHPKSGILASLAGAALLAFITRAGSGSTGGEVTGK
jgi:hypothetical protein